MRWFFIFLATIAGGAVIFSTISAETEMPKLQVELIVDSPLATSGGTLFVIPNHLTRAEFDARYQPQESAENTLLVRARMLEIVNFVYIDTPEGNYSYRIVYDPDGPSAGKTVNEVAIGVAGAGALYIDAATNEPVQVSGGRDHHIFGDMITKNESLGIENNSLDLRVNHSQCTAFGPVRVCPAQPAGVSRLLEVLRLERAE